MILIVPAIDYQGARGNSDQDDGHLGSVGEPNVGHHSGVTERLNLSDQLEQIFSNFDHHLRLVMHWRESVSVACPDPTLSFWLPTSNTYGTC
jgi:hypothetical protein